MSSPDPTVLGPEPFPSVPARRVGRATWLNGRSALGVLLVLVAVLAGALFLERAQRLVPVYAAARPLPSGVPLSGADLEVVRVRLPAAALAGYLRPGQGGVAGRVLTGPLPQHALVLAGQVVAARDAGTVELPVKVDPGDLAQGLRPGDRVQVLAAWTDGPRAGKALPVASAAEVVALLRQTGGIGGDGQSGVQIRLPGDQAAAVAAAIASARVFVVKGPALPPSAGAISPAAAGPWGPR